MDTNRADAGALAHEVGTRWWVLVVAGALVAAVGMLVIIRPVAGVFGVAVFVGLGFVLAGLNDLVAAAQLGPARWAARVWGAVSVAVGVAVLVWPAITVVAVAWLVGLGLVARGAIQVVSALVLQPPRRVAWVVAGIIEVAVGVAVMAWPEVSLSIVAVLLGIYLVFAGVVQMALGAAARSLR
ncbi:MAG: DUF308 domain-containing protein [Acidimicrobiia bacterium]|nr:DUF308 domain-containing protein [Acidimicrobiia bacterium]